MSNSSTFKAGKDSVAISNLDKVFYPETDFTKGDVISYYAKIAPVLLPHLYARPLTMKRYPNGAAAPFFYEKQCPRPTPPFVKTFEVSRHHKSGSIHYCLVNNLPTLIWATNLADLELHTFLSHAPHIHRPSAIVYDLDPGPPADAVECAQVALWLKDMFDYLKLTAFIKSSGSKGLQIYIPLNTPATYDQTSQFAKAVADALTSAHPELVVSNMKKDLRHGKVFVDWSQNSETKTTVSVYSLRAKERPYVSMPLEWPEIGKCLKKEDASLVLFEAEEALRRVRKKGDIFAPVLTLKQNLKAALASFQSSKPAQGAGKRLKSKGDGELSIYHAKRNFDLSPEPRHRSQPTSHRPLFVIQKHAASHLHYDFRLEIDGVLKSWAVPKGPPYDLKTKRLAMMVEDHPYDYARFEGIIPPDNYGAGVVMVWDIGTWENLGPPPKEGLPGGKLHFKLNGKKLKGEWALVKMHGGRATKGNEWLLLKHGSACKPISAKRDNTSALSGKSMAAIGKT